MKTNRNLYAIYRMVSFAMILSDPLDFKVTIFWTSNNSKMVQDRAIVTKVDQYKVVYDLSIGAIFNDLNDP